jgi:hypothetical protein
MVSIPKFRLQIDNKPKEFDLNAIYTVDYSNQEAIIESAKKINSWYGYFVRLLPQIAKNRDIISGNIDKIEDEVKEIKAQKFIDYKTSQDKVTDTLAKAQVEIDEVVSEAKKELFKQRDLLIETVENVNILKGIIQTLTFIEEQIKVFSYMRKLELRDEQKMSLNDQAARSMQR